MNTENENFTIRKATKDDAETIHFFIEKIAEYERLSDQVESSGENIRKYGFGERPYFETLLGEIDTDSGKKAVGFALYFFTYSTFTGKPTLYLEDIFVLEEHRGKGYGKALFIELVRIAREMECGRMEWSVLDWNEPAIIFYKNLGARPMDEWTVFRLDKNAIAKLVAD